MVGGESPNGEFEHSSVWRERLALRLARAFALAFGVGSVLLWFTLTGSARAPLTGIAIGGTAVFAPLALTGRPRGRARSWVLIAPCILGAIVSLALNGFLAAPGVLLVLSLMLSGVLLGQRTMWSLGAFTIAMVVLVAWLMTTGRIPPPDLANTSFTSTSAWMRTMGISMLATGLFGSLVLAIIDRMEQSLERARLETRRREEAEHERAEARQLETVGRLAAGIAHDFNNNLTAILGCAELLDAQLEPDADSRVLSRTIIESSHRAAELTSQLLAYSRQATMVLEPVDVHAAIDRTAKLLSRSMDPSVELTLDLSAERAVVEADTTLLESALLNLLVNARDAMPGGGRVEVRTSSSDGALQVEVEDTGAGIPEDALPRIFDPFFTTKPLGQGTGLGLAAVSGTVRSLGGNVTVRTRLGQGTVFRLTLPTSTRAPGGELPEVERLAGSGVLLLVDDQPQVLRAGERALRSLGYETVAVSSGAEAIAEVERAPDRFDLVLLDLRMPQLGGEATFNALVGINPAIRVLVWSGYGAEEDLPEMLRRGAVGFLHKPYGIAELSRAVASGVRRRSESATSAS